MTRLLLGWPGHQATRATAPRPRLNEGDVRRVAQIIVLARIAVVMSIGALVLFGGNRYGQHPVLVAAVLGVALSYSFLLLGREHFEMRYQRTAWVVTSTDCGLAFLLMWLTGGIASPVVAVLVLIVVVAALRHGPAGAALTVTCMSAFIVAMALLSEETEVEFDVRVLAVWWPVYIVLTTVLTSALSALVEREHESRLRAALEAEEEHAAAEEERDLRQRLLDAYQSQQDGLRVILHEFRTPVLSLSGLTEALADTSRPLTLDGAATTARIASEHIRHLDDMLGALGDVAISWRPAFAAGRIRSVQLLELTRAAAHAAGVDDDRLTVTTSGSAQVWIDAQAFTRVVTNLVENAARHSGDAPVTIEVAADAGVLVLKVMDRGPGVPASVHGEMSRMYTSVGNQHGTAGLGLWIVQQIVDAFGGKLTFSDREGGGLVVTVQIPLARLSGVDRV